MRTDLAWAAVTWPGLEHVIGCSSDTGFHADSLLLMFESGPARVSYQLDCDAGWRFRELIITVAGTSGERSLVLTAADGRWRTDGTDRPDLAGCVDIDINCTPLTNTLPIRRLTWSPGAAVDLSIAYVSVPELDVQPVRQRYTKLAAGLYRYESGSFRADLPVDEGGFVLDYPGIWARAGENPGSAPG